MCVSVCMRVLIYFLSFAQIEKKMNKQKKKTYDGSAEAFIFYWIIIIVIVPLSVQDFFFFPHVFVLRETSNTSEKHKCQEERGGEDGQISSLSSFLLREEFGQIFL